MASLEAKAYAQGYYPSSDDDGLIWPMWHLGDLCTATH
jgi:hypothetical protein